MAGKGIKTEGNLYHRSQQIKSHPVARYLQMLKANVECPLQYPASTASKSKDGQTSQERTEYPALGNFKIVTNKANFKSCKIVYKMSRFNQLCVNSCLDGCKHILQAPLY